MSAEPEVEVRPPFLTLGKVWLAVGSLALLAGAIAWAALDRMPSACDGASLEQDVELAPWAGVELAPWAGVAKSGFAATTLPFAARVEEGGCSVNGGDLVEGIVNLCLDPGDRDTLIRWFMDYCEANGLRPPVRHTSYFGDLEMMTPEHGRGRGLRIVYQAERGWAQLHYSNR